MPSRLLSETFEGVPGGMNVAVPPQSIADSEARYLQDALVDLPGIVRRRGPVSAFTGMTALTEPATGLAGAINPIGQFILGVLGGSLSGSLGVYPPELNGVATPTSLGIGLEVNRYKSNPDPAKPYSARPAIGGGSWIGISSGYKAPIATATNQGLVLWGGGRNAHNTGTGTITATKGSAAVTGAGTTFQTLLTPGMFIYADAAHPFKSVLLGMVKSIESNTALTLVKNAPFDVAAKPWLTRTTRPLYPKVAKGRVTCDTSSATVTGANTKFSAQGLGEQFVLTGTTTNTSPVITGLPSTSDLAVGMLVTGTGITAGAVINSIDSSTQVTISIAATASGTVPLTFKTIWLLYRTRDDALIGKVTGVTTETSLTLTSNAAVACNNERFYALRFDIMDSTVSSTINGAAKVGFLTALYAERQWYANNGIDLSNSQKVWFSEPGDAEALDLSPNDGDFIEITSRFGNAEPIIGLQSCSSSLLVLKEKEAYAIFGTAPSNFTVRKLEDDGTLSAMSVAAFGGGAIWAGRNGIYYFDGVEIQNIVADKLGDFWKSCVRGFDSSLSRMYGAVIRDHYFLHVDTVTPPIPVVKGSTSTSQTAFTIVVNLATRAVSIHTNLGFIGFVQVPADNAYFPNKPIYLVNRDLGTPVVAVTPSTSGGSLGTGTYDYKVVARGPDGESRPREVSTSVTGPNGSVLLTWNVVTNATAYRVYRFFPLLPGHKYVEVSSPTFTHTADAQFTLTGEPSHTSSSSPVCDADDLFDSTGVDEFATQDMLKGPDFFLESKKFYAADATRKKLFKIFIMHYLVQGGNIKLDTVVGLNNIGQTSLSTFTAGGYTWSSLINTASNWDTLKNLFPAWDEITNAFFVKKRIKFQKRGDFFSVRLYQSSSSVTKLVMGAYGIFYKLQRLGKV